MKATNSWYDELNQCGYSYDSGESRIEGCVIGHFTQVVWAGSLKAGFGRATDKSGGNIIIVAQYTPPGNRFGGNQDNVFPPTTRSNPLITRMSLHTCWLLWSEDLNQFVPLNRTYQTESLSKLNYKYWINIIKCQQLYGVCCSFIIKFDDRIQRSNWKNHLNECVKSSSDKNLR